MIEPLVSVTISVYNNEKFIKETINSIINQTYKNIEIIIIDDGSTDNSYQKVLEMKSKCEERFVRTIIRTKMNEGLCVTDKKLLEEVCGEFVYMIASDDVAKSDAIETEVSFLVNNKDYVLAVGASEIIDENSNICYIDKNDNIVSNINDAKFKTISDYFQNIRKLNFKGKYFGEYSTLLALGNYIPNGCLFRKEIYDKTSGFTNKAPLEDYWLNLQLSKYGKFKYFDNILFSYRIHKNNTFSNSKKMRAIARQTYKYEFQLLKTMDFSECLNNIKKTFLLYLFFGKLVKFAKKIELKMIYKKLI